VGEKGIDLWRVAGRFNAIKNPCPHQHIPALHEGTIVGTKPTFPMHPWTFSLETTFSDWGEVSL
jgi:nitrite reductase/ring-hydroxylating ferredoxin subunit